MSGKQIIMVNYHLNTCFLTSFSLALFLRGRGKTAQVSYDLQYKSVAQRGGGGPVLADIQTQARWGSDLVEDLPADCKVLGQDDL